MNIIPCKRKICFKIDPKNTVFSMKVKMNGSCFVRLFFCVFKIGASNGSDFSLCIDVKRYFPKQI